ncbi:MAG: amino acid synthesis family protein [Acidimicrobiia bacterium]|nr:amino acid synthesis family protein [Acidimicrobiia bacterium]MXZ07639.1 amino acid synthesis family protein [Acidimicrobiia bacterium]MYD04080.1 amino acid synthesis family protein [Acidimicrobiia bacterium]MYF26935.1 amino acid synthesis family protein [Acidimicrobiia bacterium]MYH54887.1 amino acid synthesis family protein [Acidimicrobiia bacterium]
MIHLVEEERSREGIKADPPLRKAVVAAVIHNPYAGRYHADLSEGVEFSVGLGRIMGEMALETLGEPILSYGKGGIAGIDGSQEHAVMFLSTAFANPLRQAMGGGVAWMSSATIVAVAGTPITLPLAHKDALYVRDNYDAITLHPGDAPRPDEVLVAVAVANRGRPNARMGGLAASDVEGVDGLR